MKPQRIFSLLALLLVLLEISSAVVAATKTTDFIRTSCGATLYKDVCISSLSRYAKAVKNDPARLARVAMRVSLNHVKSMKNYLSNLSRKVHYGSDHRVAAAVQDCVSMFGDAMDAIRDSEKQMKSLRTGAESIESRIDDINTYMSSALTYEHTCVDGFEVVTDHNPVKTDVSDRVTKAQKFTSIALALFHRYADKLTAP